MIALIVFCIVFINTILLASEGNKKYRVILIIINISIIIISTLSYLIYLLTLGIL